VNELDRDGFAVGVEPMYRTGAGRHRELAPQDALARVHLAVGPQDIARWEATPGARKVAEADPRTPAEREESRELMELVERELRALPAADQQALRKVIAVSNYAAVVDPDMPPAASRALRRIGDLDFETAVFIAPPGA
jgi:hypothetical protein